jgi:hypothetical protein
LWQDSEKQIYKIQTDNRVEERGQKIEEKIDSLKSRAEEEGIKMQGFNYKRIVH